MRWTKEVFVSTFKWVTECRGQGSRKMKTPTQSRSAAEQILSHWPQRYTCLAPSLSDGVAGYISGEGENSCCDTGRWEWHTQEEEREGGSEPGSEKGRKKKKKEGGKEKKTAAGEVFTVAVCCWQSVSVMELEGKWQWHSPPPDSGLSPSFEARARSHLRLLACTASSVPSRSSQSHPLSPGPQLLFACFSRLLSLQGKPAFLTSEPDPLRPGILGCCTEKRERLGKRERERGRFSGSPERLSGWHRMLGDERHAGAWLVSPCCSQRPFMPLWVNASFVAFFHRIG